MNASLYDFYKGQTPKDKVIKVLERTRSYPGYIKDTEFSTNHFLMTLCLWLIYLQKYKKVIFG